MLNDIEDIRFTARSEENLRGVHPDLVRVIRLALRYSLVPFSVSEGLRSMARQRKWCAPAAAKRCAAAT